MNTDSFVGMINNAAFLLALGLLYDTLSIGQKGFSRLHKIAAGLIIGIIGVAVMLNPWQLLPGLVFDTRSILLGLTGLFFGLIPTAIAVLMTGALRAFQGGIGMLMGLPVIVTSAGIGLLWGLYRKPGKSHYRWSELYLFGITVHVVMLLCAFFMPWPIAVDTLKGIFLPVLIIYPVGTVLLGKLLDRQQARRKMEDALHESEERYRSLFENSNAVMLLIDSENGMIMDANRTACTYYGWTKDEFKRKKISEINVLTDDEVMREMQAAQTEKRNHFYFMHRRADGSVSHVEVYSGPIQFRGKTYLYSIVHDISDRKLAERERDRIEEELRQVQKMDAIGLLAGGIAHDFNNMLSVILGNADIILSKIDADNPTYENLVEIKHAGQRSADLTRQLLAFSRKQIVSPKIINLNNLIQNQLGILGRLIGEDIEIRFIPGDALWNVRIDPVQANQILTNLAANARDAITGVGIITIRTENIVLDQKTSPKEIGPVSGQFVRLTFHDNGVGMDDETRERIFEPFFTTKDKGKGTGLGLPTVYGIVMQCEGAIHASSERRKGTTFSIYLPRFEGEEDAPAEMKGDLPEKGKERILIVEDEKQILNLAGMYLEQLGYEIMTAHSPEQALPLVETCSGDIHLLLTDVVMPGMNGKEFEQRIRQLKPGIKTLFMSGYTADVIAKRGVVEEGINFIQKPFTMKDLAVSIRQILDRK